MSEQRTGDVCDHDCHEARIEDYRRALQSRSEALSCADKLRDDAEGELRRYMAALVTIRDTRQTASGARLLATRALQDGHTGQVVAAMSGDWTDEEWDGLQDRVYDLRAWATSRIRACRREEEKFGAAWREKHSLGPPQALVEAWTERRSLQAVLDILETSNGIAGSADEERC